MVRGMDERPTLFAGSWMAAIGRSHVVRFLIAGGLIFAVVPRPESGRDVHLTHGQLAALYGADVRHSGRTLDDARRREIDERAVEDEILYREALRLGLDRGDGVVRQRLIQKALFLAEDLAGAGRPATDAELRAYFEANRARYDAPERARVVHVFAGPGRREMLAALRPAAQAAAGDAPPDLGDAFPLSRAIVASRAEIADTYGAAFADAVFTLPEGAWSEPIPSKFGFHLVRVIKREAARPQTFAEVKDRLRLDYLVARKDDATRAFLADAFARYRVDVDGAVLHSLHPAGRAAPPRRIED